MSWRQEAAVIRGRIDGLMWVLKIMAKQDLATHGDLVSVIRDQIEVEAKSLPVPDSGPATSKDAAKSMTIKAGSLRHRALIEYAKGPLTDEEVGDRMGHPRIWPRCSELRSLGLIQDTGEVRAVPRTKRECSICEITSSGRVLHGQLES